MKIGDTVETNEYYGTKWKLEKVNRFSYGLYVEGDNMQFPMKTLKELRSAIDMVIEWEKEDGRKLGKDFEVVQEIQDHMPNLPPYATSKTEVEVRVVEQKVMNDNRQAV